MKPTNVRYKGEILTLTEHYGRPCLFIQKPSQINMPKMRFVGGYPNEYCIYISELTEEEKRSIKSVWGRRLDVDRLIAETQEQES